MRTIPALALFLAAAAAASACRSAHGPDQPAASDPTAAPQLEFEVIRLAYAPADELVETVRALQPPGSTARFEVDARTNSLLVMALPAEMEAIKSQVARLDVRVEDTARG